MPNRDHALVIDRGRREVADTALRVRPAVRLADIRECWVGADAFAPATHPAGALALYLQSVPRVFPLRTHDLPDIGDHLIHFTGRTGGRYAVPEDIRGLDAPTRLAQILYQGRIRAVPTFGTGGRPIVAFTESSQPSVLRLISEGRYTPWGIGFSKQFIFNQGGAPVFCIRGDEWDAATAALPDPLRAHAVRFWPGAAWEEGDPVMFDGAQQLPDAITTESQWLHEREWRVAPLDPMNLGDRSWGRGPCRPCGGCRS